MKPMKPKYTSYTVIAALLSGLLLGSPVSAKGKSAKKPITVDQILNRVDDVYQGKASEGEMTMKVVTKHWTREMRIAYWSKDTNKFLLRVLAPKKDKGSSTLKNGNNIWYYLPKVRRTIKVPSSMMSGAWMGSHITNNDLVKMSRMAQDYTSKITFRGKRDGQEIIEVTSKPKKNAAVVWGKLTLTVRASDLLPLKILYYKENMKLARTMVFSNIKKFGNRLLPSDMKVVPADKPKEFTLVRYLKINFDVKLDSGMFSLRRLRR